MTPTTSAFVCLGPGVPRLEVTGKILKSKGSQHENTRDRRKFQGIVVMEKWIEMDPHFAVDQHQAMFHFAASCAIMSSAVPVDFWAR